ncbi:SURF1 family protein [Piscinibacter sp. XHJ-5]|uniref:SURF1 family protein n=1 Tax=Piscinibacter sp. XHJ-5 TaxID=3037797 RepID=UPI0024535151|nr:SURF1 family protein [Piscinibacter sp. XHJ-5]
MALTARLGVWQLDRAAQKVALEQAIEQRATLYVLGAADLGTRLDDIVHRRVALRGRWIERATVYLDNRQMNGRPGFFVVTPLALAGGGAVVVQRGWVPRDVNDRTRLPAVATPPGEVELAGRIAPPPARLYEFDGAASGTIRQNLDLGAYAAEIGVQLPPLSVVQDAGPEDGLARQWPRPAVDVHKHYGYAFQWFALCALMAGLYVWFQLLRPRFRRSA